MKSWVGEANTKLLRDLALENSKSSGWTLKLRGSPKSIDNSENFKIDSRMKEVNSKSKSEDWKKLFSPKADKTKNLVSIFNNWGKKSAF